MSEVQPNGFLGSQALWVGPDGALAAELGLGLLRVELAQALRQVPGRETFLWPPDGARWVVKRFHGGSPRDRWYARWWAHDRRSPGQREYELLLELARAGVRVPKPVAWFQSDADSLLMMDRVPAESDLRQILTEDPKAWARFRRPLLALVVGLHGPARGTERFHRDLYLQHILVEVGTEQLWLIDVGRVGLGPKVRQRWLEKDLAALAHSAPASLGHTERLAWLGRYLTLRLGSLPRREHRARLMRWARAIDTRRARMARHRPRFGETGPMGG